MVVLPPKNDLKDCDCCYDRYHISNVHIKDTSEGRTIYCNRCFINLKKLELEGVILCKKYNITINESEC